MHKKVRCLHFLAATCIASKTCIVWGKKYIKQNKKEKKWTEMNTDFNTKSVALDGKPMIIFSSLSLVTACILNYLRRMDNKFHFIFTLCYYMHALHSFSVMFFSLLFFFTPNKNAIFTVWQVLRNAFSLWHSITRMFVWSTNTYVMKGKSS